MPANKIFVLKAISKHLGYLEQISNHKFETMYFRKLQSKPLKAKYGYKCNCCSLQIFAWIYTFGYKLSVHLIFDDDYGHFMNDGNKSFFEKEINTSCNDRCMKRFCE